MAWEMKSLLKKLPLHLQITSLVLKNMKTNKINTIEEMLMKQNKIEKTPK